MTGISLLLIGGVLSSIKNMFGTQQQFVGNVGGAPGAPPTLVKRADQPVWKQRKWQVSGNQLIGYYRTPYGSFRGIIEPDHVGTLQFFIISPPAEINQSAHRRCFHNRGNDTFWIHFNVQPRDYDTGILSVESVIREALTRRGR